MYITETDTLQENTIQFDDIYAQTSDMVLNLAYRMTGKEELARDLTQDVFLKVYQKWESFEFKSKPSTWIYRIALNHIINYMKKESRLFFFDSTDNTSAHPAKYESQVTCWQEDLPARPDAQLEKNELEKVIRAMIEKLPVKYKVPFLLFRYEEKSYQEIADYMAISLSAVESRIHRAKKKLAEKLKPWEKVL